jgi:hypothetical protein
MKNSRRCLVATTPTAETRCEEAGTSIKLPEFLDALPFAPVSNGVSRIGLK